MGRKRIDPAAVMGERLSFADAIRLIGGAVEPGPEEWVPTADAHGRILAYRVFAQRDCPPFDMSAMDGYAIAEADLSGADGRSLAVGLAHYAGDVPSPIAAGEARPIATGAAVPPGTGAILTRESATVSGSVLLLTDTVKAGLNIRPAGEDARRGEPVLDAGRRIDAAAIGALCAYGITTVRVFCRPRVAIVTIGDEIAGVGDADPGDVMDADGPMVAALLSQAGCTIVSHRIVPDDRTALAQTFAALLEDGADMIVSTGGASIGDRDFLRRAVEDLGATIHFHGVHMRPGKPALFATHDSGCAIFGLPGNPVAALVAARFFIGRSLRGWFGLGDEPALCGLDEAPEPGPTRLLKARYPLDTGPRGIEVLPGQQSHILRPLLEANAWLMRGGAEPARVYPLYDAGLT